MQGRCGREIWMDLSAIGIEQDFKSVAWVWIGAEHTQHACLGGLFIGRHGEQRSRLGQKAV